MAKTLEEHFGYLSDRIKLERYQAAIDRLVRPEHLVLDLGCGSGSLGLMALRAGARKVFFVEEGAIIEVARQTVAQAGFSARAEFIQANSYEITLPERVDVVVCDHVGYFGFDYGILGLLADAKQRFLNPGGILIPQAIDLKLAPVESEACRKRVGQWRDGSVPKDFDWLGTTAANTKHGVNLGEADLLAAPATLTTLELGAEAAPFLCWRAEFESARDGRLDGLCGWFKCGLGGDASMTNAPAATDSLQRPQAFLPLENPLDISTGDRIVVTVMARHQDHVLAWTVEIPGTGERFAHSTFNGLLLDRASLTRAQPDRVAKLTDRGRARQIVLSYCDGQRTVAEVQALVNKDHPALFPSAQATSSFITEVLSWDTRG